jgi:hypothetical protein
MSSDRMTITNPKTGKKEYLVGGDNEITDMSACAHERDKTGRCAKCGRKIPSSGEAHEQR